jgi:nicotinamidase/pyrazinamidase
VEKYPRFYNARCTGTIFYPDITAIAAEALKAGLAPSAADGLRTLLLIVDMQVDFCHTAGALYVPGAVEDVQRLIQFIYRFAEHITSIICSLDSHLPFQIFHSAWWVDRKGNHPPPFTIIKHEDVITGKWQPLLETEWSAQYTRRLQEQAKKELTIWPYHCLTGSVGHSLDPELFSAVLWHALARNSQPTWWTKGSIPKTEHYSIVQPEIPVPEHPQGGKSQEFLNLLKWSDRIFVAGEAESHCVLETLEDLVEEFSGQPEILRRIFVLQDCTSPVRHPEIDYETITHKRFTEFAEKGVHFIKSTDPPSWENSKIRLTDVETTAGKG